MNPMTIKLLTSSIILVAAFFVRYLIVKALRKMEGKYGFDENRADLIVKVVNYGISILAGLIILGVWEIETDDFALYLASIFTVIGVAFFAQWSHLSNVTGAFILYFAHSIKVGDEIEIMDKEVPVKGIIRDINLFFINIRDKNGQQFTLSNTLFLQKIIGYKLKRKNHDN